jgi:hypothetical protein
VIDQENDAKPQDTAAPEDDTENDVDNYEEIVTDPNKGLENDKKIVQNKAIQLLLPFVATYLAAESRQLKVGLGYAVLATITNSIVTTCIGKLVHWAHQQKQERVHTLITKYLKG